MKFLIRLLILVGLIVLLDVYTFQAIKVITQNVWVRRSYWIFHGFYYALVLVVSVMAMSGNRSSSSLFSWMFSLFVALYLPKLIVVIFLLFEDGSRLVRSIIRSFQSNGASEGGTAGLPGQPITRAKFVSTIALATASIPFAATLWGIIRTKYDYAVRNIKIPIKNLPEAFEGFKITQISDIHTGSFDNKKAVARGVEMVNEQGSDIICFTGDLVNNVCTELEEEYVEIFSKLKAPEGVYSILGNHDYGDYHRWSSKEEKEQNMADLFATQKKMGWDLLLNENRVFERKGQKLALLGVENWSAWSRFPAHGILEDAYKGVEDVPTKVLLSHDPTHWDAQVRPEYPDIDLTLSGHTHGMQFGIEIPGFKWSPVQYMFKQWAGLYTEGDQHIYVNRGFGFIGFSGRVGIRPEITVLELTKA